MGVAHRFSNAPGIICWVLLYSPDRGGVFASPTPQTAELVAELFATERDRFPPFQLQFIGAFEGVFVFVQPGGLVGGGHFQSAIIYILIDWCIRYRNFQPSPYAVIASGRSMRVADSVDRIISIISLSLCRSDPVTSSTTPSQYASSGVSL